MSSAIEVRVAETDAEIAACFPVMNQLRTHLKPDEFVARVRGQEKEGFRLAFLADEGVVQAVAGYRIMSMLFSGRTLYVDDLVTNENTRSRGYGGQLLTWVAKQAKAEGCGRLTLDSGVEKMHAHRFYHRMGMAITAHHFTWLRPL